MFVFDASPLIVLASANHLDVLASIDRQLVVPELVREEVVDAGIAAGHADARRVKAAIEDDLFTVEHVDRSTLFAELAALDGLSEADAAVIAHASATEATAVVDGRRGRSVAAVEDVETRGTAFLVLSQVADGPLTATEGKAIVDDLVDAGWYCSTDLYRKIDAKLDDL